jgi:hypothetical protein
MDTVPGNQGFQVRVSTRVSGYNRILFTMQPDLRCRVLPEMLERSHLFQPGQVNRVYTVLPARLDRVHPVPGKLNLSALP